jgi:hypothetical protein
MEPAEYNNFRALEDASSIGNRLHHGVRYEVACLVTGVQFPLARWNLIQLKRFPKDRA